MGQVLQQRADFLDMLRNRPAVIQASPAVNTVRIIFLPVDTQIGILVERTFFR
jgi:hypothetical protein